MRWTIISIVLFVAPNFVHADFIQLFSLPTGETIHSPITVESLDYLRKQNEAPEWVYQSHIVAGEEYLTPIKTSSIFWKPRTKVAQADELPLEESLKMYADAMANIYGANKKQLRATIQCESGWDNSARGKAGEIGIAQYMPNTFRLFEKEFGEDLSIYSARDQLKLTAWAFSEGEKYRRHWTCYRKLSR